MTDSSPRSRSRRTLLVLAGVFLLPVAASFLLYYGVGWRPAGSTNHGALLPHECKLKAGAA